MRWCFIALALLSAACSGDDQKCTRATDRNECLKQVRDKAVDDELMRIAIQAAR
jgi:hypothetical protein